ncbi:MAG: hypothetical protein VYA34_04020 [Myxococcota bacterium]|nr:hypothetical protein [Myxococcota bacterium]
MGMVKLRAPLVMTILLWCNGAFAQDANTAAPTTGSDPIQETIKLKDGNIVRGVVKERTETHWLIESELGELKIPVDKMAKPHVLLKLSDGSLLRGELLKQTNEAFVLQSSLGKLTVPTSKIASFKFYYPNSQDKPQATPTKTAQPGGLLNILLPEGSTVLEKESRETFSHTIEPLIDIFFDPTAYVFESGDIYLSGLSLAYGLTDTTLLSLNLVTLVGLNETQNLNPNIELKWQPYFSRGNKVEHGIAVGIRSQTFTYNGNHHTFFNAAGQEEGYEKRRTNFEEEENSRYANRSSYSTEDMENTTRLSQDVNQDPYYIEKEDYGWETQLYVANSLSWLLQRGGRFGLHAGAQIEYNSFNFRKWTSFPTYRFHLGFDLDLSKYFKILGEVFYDPDFRNHITGAKGMGIDFGIMIAATDRFRVLFHLQPYFLGLYWRF